MKKVFSLIIYFCCLSACNPNRRMSYKNDHFNAGNLPVNNSESAVWESEPAPGLKSAYILTRDSLQYIVVSNANGIAITFHRSLKHLK